VQVTFKDENAKIEALRAAEDKMRRVFGGNVEVLAEDVGPRRAKVRLWVDDPDGPGGKRSYSGRRTHYASWAAFGVLVHALLLHGATRVATPFVTYRDLDNFWANAPRVCAVNVGSVMAPVRYGELSVRDREYAITPDQGREVLKRLIG